MTKSVATVDARPFFEKAIRYGLDQGLLSQDNMSRMGAEAPKGIVQIADHFGTAYLRTDLESAATRMTNLISLYLEDSANGDLRVAAISLRDNTLLSHSRGGSEMLKRLHAMPGETSLHSRKVDPLAQKLFVNERSFAFPISVASYREQVRQCQANQMRIDFARWLARQMLVKQDEYEDFSAEEVIRSAMLVLFVGGKALEMPSKSQFVELLGTLRKKTFKPRPAALDSFLRDAPEAFDEQTRQAMQGFINDVLPRLKSTEKSPDEILHAEAQGAFFIREVAEEDVVAYDKIVAREWVRITKGNADDPAVLATIFLNVATGHPAKASALLKEAKAIIQSYRAQGFDSNAVLKFVDDFAPFEQREDLKAMWLQDLLLDAEVHLADNDPQMPDAFMERALRYFKQNCVGAWKGSSR
ncbi:hypothetical protein [Dechloromonas denitrificans]|uniref:hypothetical protein n=1 Tax=Dechloromonas denitrificans TaxID=281362 RepID=UPI001CFBDD4C|nr:hypothetical protein [Dechloromonas denitrificans]UCV08215.1 hypothetical protein KI615_01415 [Dechloromonas denitrificans]